MIDNDATADDLLQCVQCNCREQCLGYDLPANNWYLINLTVVTISARVEMFPLCCSGAQIYINHIRAQRVCTHLLKP